MKAPASTRKYTAEEKQQLVKNLDIEVEHRVRQLEEWLAGALENFRLHQEGLISRIPRIVRAVSMADFADKYGGDVQACLKGLQSERVGTTEFEIDRDTRKRKWAAALEEAEASGSGSGHDDHRAPKNARMTTATPKKPVAGPSKLTATRTPGTIRPFTTRPPIPKPSPAPQKASKPPPFVVRAASPAKAANQRARPPSTSTFNPTMPPKAPTYPTLRAPRRDESMLSVNGSPLANPYTLGLGWFAGPDVEEEESHLQAKAKGKGKGKGEQSDDRPNALRRVDSIVIRRDPSTTLASSSSSSQPKPQSQSQTNGTRAQPPPDAPSNTAPPSALVSIPTREGHLLEFDPLATSPRALDMLVGITDSAKKQAKEEMARLVKEAMRKWVIE